MEKKIGSHDHRILLAAVFLSLVWHFFWLTTIKIVAYQGPSRPVKFSKVSFLGPILTRGAIEVRMDPAERTFLEKRYAVNAGEIYSNARESGENHRSSASRESPGLSKRTDEQLAQLIGQSVTGMKMEPPSEAD